MLDALRADFRYALRGLRRAPGFTIAAVLTLALGIGANTAIFSLLDAVMFRPLPVPEAADLFMVYEVSPEAESDVAGGTGQLMRFSYSRFTDLERAMPAGTALAAMTRPARLTIRSSQDAALGVAAGQLVSADFFDTFGARAAAGRLLGGADTRQPGADAYAVLSERFWERRFGRDSSIVGRTVVLNGVPFTVAGVAAAPFAGPWTDVHVDVWVPLTMQHALNYRNNASISNSEIGEPWLSQEGIAWLNLAGRAPRAQHAQVAAALQVANRSGLQRFADVFGGDAAERRRVLGRQFRLESFSRGFSGVRTRFSDALFLLSAMVGLVLLIACANVANLLLARAATRVREVAIRASLGATRARLLRQNLTESLLLAAIGGGLGIVAARWASVAMATMALNATPGSLPPGFALDGRSLAFAAAVSAVTAIVFGLAPALRSSRVALHGSMSAGDRAASAPATRGMRPLVGVQIALSFIVIVVAGLFARSLANYATFDPGFERESLVTAAIDPLISGYTVEQMPALHGRLVDAVRPIPGVVSASVAACGLVSNCESVSDFVFEGYQPARGEVVSLNENRVGAGYFATIGTQILEGRDFSERDGPNQPVVAIVNEAVMQRYFGGRSPIGRRLGYDEQLEAEVIGVVRDARHTRLQAPPPPMIYFSIQQPQQPVRSLEVRVTGDPAQAAAAVRVALQRAEPNLLLDRIVPMTEQLDRTMTQERLVTYLTTAFGALALFLACIGLYGVLTYAVARRRREFGVRVALGAAPAQLIRLVVGDGMRVAGAGLIAGVVLALAAARFVGSLLFNVTAVDAATYAGVAALLGGVALAASYLPARRASRVDPMTALRAE